MIVDLPPCIYTMISFELYSHDIGVGLQNGWDRSLISTISPNFVGSTGTVAIECCHEIISTSAMKFHLQGIESEKGLFKKYVCKICIITLNLNLCTNLLNIISCKHFFQVFRLPIQKINKLDLFSLFKANISTIISI